MRIILTQNVPNVGALGDEVSVRDGYARNYLVPRGMAIAAGSANARALQHRRRMLDKLRAEAVQKAEGDAERLGAIELTLKVPAGPGGKLFGTVTNRDLEAALAQQGIEADRKAISLHEPVRSVGSYTATVRLHTEVRREINFRVLAEEGSAGAAEHGEGSEQTAAEGAEQPAGESAASDQPGPTEEEVVEQEAAANAAAREAVEETTG